jgi:phosphoglucosamine mutase
VKSATGSATTKPKSLPTGKSIGTAERIRNPSARYEIFAVNCLRSLHLDLNGMKVALDCAHGASFQSSPETLRRLGAEVAAINTTFTGDDINVRCGSTHLEPLRKMVTKVGADLGIAHDGDADRVLAISSSGAVIDGDLILAILARDLQERGELPGNTVVSTVMANLGFMRAMQELGIAVKQTDVGDANVLQAMRAGGFVVGGEQSGHIILSKYNSTGDGLITALMLMAVMQRSGKSLDELATVMTSYPQVLQNVKSVDKTGLNSCAALADAVRAAEERLEKSGGGRVLLRASGTEPVVRVMVEAQTTELAQSVATQLAAEVSEHLSL